MATSPLSVSNSDVKVMNAALALLGVPAITSFLDNTIAARTGNQLYADVLEDALSAYPWRFARDRVKLARLPDAAPPPWEGLYQIPTAAIVVQTIYEDDQRTLFDVFGRKVAVMIPETSTAEVWAEHTAMVGPDQWPGYFREAFIAKLAGLIAMPVTQDERTAAFWLQQGTNMLLRAQSRDAQGRSPSRVDTKSFIRARRGGGRF